MLGWSCLVIAVASRDFYLTPLEVGNVRVREPRAAASLISHASSPYSSYTEFAAGYLPAAPRWPRPPGLGLLALSIIACACVRSSSPAQAMLLVNGRARGCGLRATAAARRAPSPRCWTRQTVAELEIP